VGVFTGKNSVNQPLDEQGVQEKHQAAQDDHGNAKQMCPQEGPYLSDKPPKLGIKSQTQECSSVLSTSRHPNCNDQLAGPI